MIKAVDEWRALQEDELNAVLESKGVAKKRFNNLMYKGIYTATDTPCTIKGLVIPPEGVEAYKAVLDIEGKEHVINLDHLCHMQQPSFRKDIQESV